MQEQWIATVRTKDGGSYRGTGKDRLSCEPMTEEDATAWATTMTGLDARLVPVGVEEVKRGM